MQRILNNFSAISAGILSCVFLAVDLKSSSAEHEAPAGRGADSVLKAFDIRGVVEDTTPDLSDEAFERLERSILYKPGNDASNIPPTLLDRYIRRELSIPFTARQIVDLLAGETLSGDERQELIRMQRRVKDDLDQWARFSPEERGEFLALHMYGDVLESLFGSKLVVGAVVTLRGDGVEEEVRTDEKGEFRFVGFTEGRYELNARARSRWNPKSQAWGTLAVHFVPGRKVRVAISDYALILRGRVATDAGEPVIGARISADYAFARDVLPGPLDRKTERDEGVRVKYGRTAVTDGNGVFEISGIPPPDLEIVWRYIAGGVKGALSEYAAAGDGQLDGAVECAFGLQNSFTPRRQVTFESRWKEALDAGFAPPVVLEATHIDTLKVVSRSILEEHGLSDERG
jgi:hypothetical protein